MRTLIQLWSVKDYLDTEKNIVKTAKRIKAIGYDGVELFFPGDMEKFALLVKHIREAGLEIPSMHVDNDILKNHAKEIKAIVNLEFVVIPCLDYGKGEDEVVEKIKELLRLKEEIKDIFPNFYYHNHDFELLHMKDGETILNKIEKAGILCEYDTYWLMRGGLDPVRYIKNNQPAPLLHLKDYRLVKTEDGLTLKDSAVGESNLPIKELHAVAEGRNVKYFVVEQENNKGTFEQVMRDMTISYNNLEKIYKA